MPGDDTNNAPSAWVVLAHLLRPQGRRGEVLAELLTDFPERFAGEPRVFLAPPGFAGSGSEARAIQVANHWLPVGRNHGRIVLHFQAIDTIEQAEALAGLDVIVPAEERTPLEDDAEYISDLLDCTVFDLASGAPRLVGTVTAVDFPTTPDGARRLADAAPLLTVLTPEDDEVLIPYVQSFLLKLDTPAKRIHMNLPPGLVELNKP